MSRARKMLSAVVAVVTLFVLSGCLVFEADLAVDKDLNVSGTSTVGVMVKDLEGTGVSPQDIMGDVDEEFDLDNLPAGTSVKPIDTEEMYGYELTYDNVSQEDLDFETGGTQIFIKDGDTIRFELENPFYEAEAGTNPDDPFGGNLGVAEILTSGKIAIAFPGKVIEAPGATIDGNKVTWDLATFSEPELTAQANVGGGSWLTALLIILVIIAIAVAVGIIATRRKKKDPATSAGIAPQGYENQGYGHQGYGGADGTQGFPAAGQQHVPGAAPQYEPSHDAGQPQQPPASDWGQPGAEGPAQPSVPQEPPVAQSPADGQSPSP